MRWLLTAAAGVLLLALPVLAGYRLPVEHTATRRLRLAQPREAVWARVADIAGQGAWRKTRPVRVEDIDGRPAWREGDLVLITEEERSPERLVRRLAPGGAFGGSWTVVLDEDGAATSVTVTEQGEVYNPLFRVVSRYVLGHTRTIDGYLRDLARSFGETAELEAVDD